MRCVTSYGFSDIGITTYAPVPPGLGFMQRNFEVRLGGLHAGGRPGAGEGCLAVRAGRALC